MESDDLVEYFAAFLVGMNCARHICLRGRSTCIDIILKRRDLRQYWALSLSILYPFGRGRLRISRKALYVSGIRQCLSPVLSARRNNSWILFGVSNFLFMLLCYHGARILKIALTSFVLVVLIGDVPITTFPTIFRYEPGERISLTSSI